MKDGFPFVHVSGQVRPKANLTWSFTALATIRLRLHRNSTRPSLGSGRYKLRTPSPAMRRIASKGNGSGIFVDKTNPWVFRRCSCANTATARSIQPYEIITAMAVITNHTIHHATTGIFRNDASKWWRASANWLMRQVFKASSRGTQQRQCQAPNNNRRRARAPGNLAF